MPRVIEVELLGPPRVVRDGELLAFDTRKAVALLAHLAVTARPRPRDALADLLWPDSDLEHARGALRRTLSSLRSAVGAASLETTRDHVRLVRGADLVVDVDAFRSSRALRPEEAVELFRGEFLEGFTLRDAPAFEDWARSEAENLRRELVAALAEVTQRRASTGDLRGALTVARRWVSLDPLHEPAHQAVIRLHADLGDRGAALTQYRECVRTLSRELGVPPLTETTELYEAVTRDGYAAPAPPPTAPRSVPAPAPRLVGRSRELAELHAAYDALGPGGGVVVVEGEAGIGKTRLVEDFLATLRTQGVRVLEGRAFQDESGLAYGPVCDALRARLREGRDWLSGADDGALAEAARLVPDLVSRGRPPEPLATGPAAGTRFLSGVWDTLVFAADGPRPGVLFLDDAQWADDGTVALLAFGLRRPTDRPLLLVLTRRTPHEDALRRAVTTAVLDGRGALVRLDRLPETAVAELLRDTPAAQVDEVDGDAARRLWERTEGVPLFVVEYLRARDLSGEWPVPAGVRDLLSARLGPLTETARQTLSAAAVIGRSFDTAAVRAVSGRTEEETVTSLEELMGHGLLREGSPGLRLRARSGPRARLREDHARAAPSPARPRGAARGLTGGDHGPPPRARRSRERGRRRLPGGGDRGRARLRQLRRTVAPARRDGPRSPRRGGAAAADRGPADPGGGLRRRPGTPSRRRPRTAAPTCLPRWSTGWDGSTTGGVTTPWPGPTSSARSRRPPGTGSLTGRGSRPT